MLVLRDCNLKALAGPGGELAPCGPAIDTLLQREHPRGSRSTEPKVVIKGLLNRKESLGQERLVCRVHFLVHVLLSGTRPKAQVQSIAARQFYRTSRPTTLSAMPAAIYWCMREEAAGRKEYMLPHASARLAGHRNLWHHPARESRAFSPVPKAVLTHPFLAPMFCRFKG